MTRPTTPLPSPSPSPQTFHHDFDWIPMGGIDFDKITAKPMVIDPISTDTNLESRVAIPTLDHNIVAAGPLDAKISIDQANEQKSVERSPTSLILGKNKPDNSVSQSGTISTNVDLDKTDFIVDKDTQLKLSNKTDSPVSPTNETPKTLRILLKKADEFLDKNIDSIKKIFQ